MKNFVITIGRQFGCGAREIGTKLAERLGVAYYNKEIIKRAAQDSGFDEKLFHFYDEKPTSSFLFNVSTDGYIPIGSDAMSLEDKIIQYQFDTIKKVASEGSCIIVGRCAEYVLRDNTNVLSVFLHGDYDYRVNRIVNLYGISEKDAAKEIKSMDKKRAKFHNFYSDSRWGDADTYDLAVDVSRLGIDETVELIATLVERKFA
ncbi:MAG: AAA family ATPase [Eubacterium sp.]